MSETPLKEILTQNNAPKERLMNFASLMEPIMKLLEKHWDITALPKGYQEYLKKAKEDDDIDFEKLSLVDEFLELGGVLNVHSATYSLPDKLSLHNVAYDDNEQNRPPLQTLLSSLVAYGLIIGHAQEKRFNQIGPSTQKILNLMDIMEEEMKETKEENEKLKAQLAAQQSNT
jgi:hypothetical protein